MLERCNRRRSAGRTLARRRVRVSTSPQAASVDDAEPPPTGVLGVRGVSGPSPRGVPVGVRTPSTSRGVMNTVDVCAAAHNHNHPIREHVRAWGPAEASSTDEPRLANLPRFRTKRSTYSDVIDKINSAAEPGGSWACTKDTQTSERIRCEPSKTRKVWWR